MYIVGHTGPLLLWGPFSSWGVRVSYCGGLLLLRPLGSGHRFSSCGELAWLLLSLWDPLGQVCGIGRRILYHWVTRGAPRNGDFMSIFVPEVRADFLCCVHTVQACLSLRGFLVWFWVWGLCIENMRHCTFQRHQPKWMLNPSISTPPPPPHCHSTHLEVWNRCDDRLFLRDRDW